jgi:hypothetical protein
MGHTKPPIALPAAFTRFRGSQKNLIASGMRAQGQGQDRKTNHKRATDDDHLSSR